MSDKPWFALYPKGVGQTINPDQYNSLNELLEESFQKFRNNPAVENMGVSLSYGDLQKYSEAFAAYIQNKTSLKPGDRLAIQSPNLLQYPIILFGALRAGLTVVNVNPLYTPRELEHQLNDSGSKAIVVVENFACNLEKVIKNTQIELVVITRIGDMLGGLKGMITNFVVKNIKKMVPAYSLPQALKFKDVLKAGQNLSFNKPEVSSKDIAFLQYTGGTTGVSKGATLTHRNVISNILQSEQWFVGLEPGKEVIITALPLYHIFALTVNCMLMTKFGAKSILVTNPRDMPGFVKELGKHTMTVFTGVNTLFNGLLNTPGFSDIDFSKLKISVGGGMAVQKAVAEKWEKVTGCALAEGYGLSETSPVLCCNPLDGTHRLGTIGLPFPNTEVVIMDDDGNHLPVGERGEICAKGPQVMLGYWNRPEETDNIFKDGYFCTGDIGIMAEDGFVRIVDRKKDMILVSGFNVYPNEVEDCVASHEKVLEVAAIGVPDDKSTEAVKVFVVKKDDSLNKEDLIGYCRENLTGYKVPKHVEFRDELPKTNVGKILRRTLKEEEQAKAEAAS